MISLFAAALFLFLSSASYSSQQAIFDSLLPASTSGQCNLKNEDVDQTILQKYFKYKMEGNECVGFDSSATRKTIRKMYKTEVQDELSEPYINNLLQDENYQKYMTCTYLNRNLKRDSLKCTPDPKKVLNSLGDVAPKNIQGKLKYMGLVNQPYRYNVEKSETGKLKIRIKIHFNRIEDTPKKLDQYDKDILAVPMKDKLKAAQDTWNKRNPASDKLEFQFDEVDDPKEAHYSVDLHQKFSRGPYCKSWSNSWRVDQVTHDLGHMMGLDDEYPQGVELVSPAAGFFFKETYCNSKSVMCDANGAAPLDYHYYLIFRRLFCN